MKRSKEELLQSLKGFIGEDESENAIAFLEDFQILSPIIRMNW